MTLFLRLFLFFLVLFGEPLFAQVPPPINVDVDSFLEPGGFSSSINLLLMMAVITLAPFFLVSITCFLRIVIVLSMIRQALATQQAPPNTVLIALSVFMTIFVMTPTWQKVYDTAVQPYQEGSISQKQALEQGLTPFRDFMFKFTREKDLALFLEFSKLKVTNDMSDVPKIGRAHV